MTKLTIRLIIFLVLAALAFFAGILATRYYYGLTAEKTKEQSTVLLERIQKVTKLITVEGYFSEVFDQKSYWMYDISLFRKQALIRVKAKVSVGYDLGQMKITMDEATRTIIVSELPKPKILSIDHDLDYYNISEGTFNSFTAEDYTRLNQKAKEFIERKARESDLFQQAEVQGNQMLEIVETMAAASGWKVVIAGTLPIEQATPAQHDSIGLVR
jgi:hypothetical protein